MTFPSQFWIVGSDTEIGKTLVSAILMSGLNAHYWKPIQSGLQDSSDTETVKRLSGAGSERFLPELYRLTEPLSPHLSARLDGISIDDQRFSVPQTSAEHLIIEAAGGLMVPLNEKSLIIDWVQKSGLPVALVARSALGTINHSLLSIQALESRGIPLLGVVMSGRLDEENRKAIERYGKTRVIAQLPVLDEPEKRNLKRIFQTYFL